MSNILKTSKSEWHGDGHESEDVARERSGTAQVLELLERYAKREGYVYLLEAEGIGRVKIGCSEEKPSERIRALKIASPVTLWLVGILRGGFSLERRLHGHFATARRKGEWFEITPEVREFMNLAAQFRLTPLPDPISTEARPSDVRWLSVSEAKAFLGGGIPDKFFGPWTNAYGQVSREEILAAMCRGLNSRMDLDWEELSRRRQ